jgi:uncharacterized RDD family membrane protein YckC
VAAWNGAVSLDTLYEVETPEGILLSLRPAGLVARLQAYLIDFTIKLVVFIALSMVATKAGGMGAAFMLITYFCLEWIYPMVFELSKDATPGKMVMGLKVVMDSGLPLTPAAAIVRNLLRAADFLPFLYAAGVCAVLCRADFKRLGDLAAGTLVVYRKAAALHRTLPTAEPAAPGCPLDAREQTAIIAWAGRAETLTPERLEELAQLAQPALPKVFSDAPAASSAKRLLGVAHWLMGHRLKNKA